MELFDLEIRQFGLRHLLIFVTVIAMTLALSVIGPHGVTLGVPFALIAAGFGLVYLHRSESRCPEYLKLRYHAPVFVLLFVATQKLTPYFFSYGLWTPPISWFFTIVAIQLFGALQISKWHDKKLPHIGSRVAQVLCLWALFLMRVLVITVGDYHGP